MIRSTQIARLDGLMLCASVDDEQQEAALSEVKSQIKQVLRKLTRNSEPQASIESGAYNLKSVYPSPVYPFYTERSQSKEEEGTLANLCVQNSYLMDSDITFICITDKSYPRKLAFTYLSDLAREFTTTYPVSQLHSPSLRPYAFMEFDTFISRTKSTYSDARASQNLDKLNDELRDVTKVMTKNIEDLLYRGDSLERMGELSSRLRDDSKKYRRAAVRINWELLLKQYGPLGALGFIVIVFFWWRFF
ncbi:transporter sec22 [Colletotrichum limetticola]|uniref:Protein transport protein SEC22 n=1 Tax=Colletotrichum limetticola TaxID=1209924 RepID=A0ABQ9PUP9_9PEZI|nr:transporter sec22 [Colletotrichum limetticola]